MIDPVPVQKRPVFFLEGPLAVMFRLIGNVGANLRYIGFAHRKGTVACLRGGTWKTMFLWF